MSLQLKSQNLLIECGTDEAGRGCLAGPVTAAAAILPDDFENKLITDSKLLSHKSRELLRPIIEDAAIAFGIAHVYPEEIDKINILNASIKAMHLAIDKLKKRPEHILVDGNRFKIYMGCSHACIIKGDSKFLSIASASILAKTERDRYMQLLNEEYPMYNWKQNKGYPTQEHREAIKEYGITPYHRKSFRLLPEQLVLNL
ncbi:ribonuclease HII [Leeuwenhoekiella sp. A16]|uniref:ribonuclease HII n=1 Tax=unclassified Leeuwenhoekiella TaxID=2615029 RepID=UPI003A80D4B0|tara:strand:+ start:1444 stop:2046 length:603 start_codon:yes stop_codon:yes gene_type:complete